MVSAWQNLGSISRLAMAASHLLLPLLCVFLTRASVSMASQQPLCLGEYQYCSEKGDCVLDASLCGTCKQGQYLCPDQKTCVGNAEAYTTCPGLKGGFFDWTLSLEERVEALAKQATLTEQIAQLTNSAPAIVRLGECGAYSTLQCSAFHSNCVIFYILHVV